MKRVSLVRRGVLTVTPDTSVALDLLETRASEMGFKVRFSPKEIGTEPRFRSLSPAGRAVSLEAVYEDGRDVSLRLAALWSAAIPLRFTPHTRDPLPDANQSSFYYLGPWQTLYDNLMSEGRGHLSWVSVCVAAQVDAGVWEGDRVLERFVQAQIHRLGLNCGPIDGRVGERTQGVLRSMGLQGSLGVVAEDLAKRPTPSPVVPRVDDRKVGHLVLPGNHVVTTSGSVKSQKTSTGHTIFIDGPGRLIVEVV